jgi:hypothetical protein
MPFGIGAVLGGVGSNILGRKIVESSRQAFGPAPAFFPENLNPRVRVPREPRQRKLPVPLLKQLPRGKGK